MSKGRGKKGVNYIVQEEPAFLKQFKQKVGYKEGPTIDTKVSHCLSFDFVCMSDNSSN